MRSCSAGRRSMLYLPQSHHGSSSSHPNGRKFFFQAEDVIRDLYVTGVQTCALPIFQKEKVKVEPEARAIIASASGSTFTFSFWRIDSRRARMSAGPIRLKSNRCRRLSTGAADCRSEERRVGKEWRATGCARAH